MIARMGMLAALGWAALLVGCRGDGRGGDEDQASQAVGQRRGAPAAEHPDPPTRDGRPPRDDPGEGRAGEAKVAPRLGRVEVEDTDAGARAESNDTASGDCVAEGPPTVVWSRGGPAAVASADRGWLVAGYAPGSGSDGGEEVFLARVDPGGATMPVTRNALGAPWTKGDPRAAPGLLARGGTAWVARVDGAGKLAVARVAHRQPGAPLRFREVAEGVDARFAPTLARMGQVTLVAWVDGRGTPMRVRVAALGRALEVVRTHDVTLDAMGGTAPVFVSGATPPELVYVDARAGMSPLVRVRFDGQGTPGAATVKRTVGQVPEPPQLAAVRFGGETWVAYTAVGSGATAAVGLVPLGTEGTAPVPLVKGAAYGKVAVGATAMSGAAVFVTEAPVPEGDGRALEVRRVDGQDVGEAWALAAAADARGYPAVATAGDGSIAVVRRVDGAVQVAIVRCAEP